MTLEYTSHPSTALPSSLFRNKEFGVPCQVNLERGVTVQGPFSSLFANSNVTKRTLLPDDEFLD